MVASSLDKSGHHGCTLKIDWIGNFLFFIFSRFCSGFSAFQSWKSPTASSSTEHKAAAFLICSMLMSGFLDSCRLSFRGAGESSGVFGVVGNNSWEENEEGLRGMKCEQGSLMLFFHKIVILGGGFDMDRAVCGRVLGEKSVVGGRVFVVMSDSPFVGEVVEVVELVEGEVVVEVVEEVVAAVELEVESEKRGLLYDEIELNTFFWRPLLRCPFSSSS